MSNGELRPKRPGELRGTMEVRLGQQRRTELKAREQGTGAAIVGGVTYRATVAITVPLRLIRARTRTNSSRRDVLQTSVGVGASGHANAKKIPNTPSNRMAFRSVTPKF